MVQHAHRSVEIVNDLGLHMRAANALSQLANEFTANITLRKGDMKANAKSIMSVLSLTAGKGAMLDVDARGEDSQAAVDALTALISSGFRQE